MDLIDFRVELRDFLFNPSNPRGQQAVLRKIRYDGNNKKIPCPHCYNTLTRVVDRSHPCPVCLGETFLWDEKFIRIYKTDFATGNPRSHDKYQEWFTIFIESSERPSSNDRVIELHLEDNGDPTIPYKRTAKHIIESITDLREKNGRVEFYEAMCRTEGNRQLNNEL